MVFGNLRKILKEQDEKREAIWICDWCGHENDSRVSECTKCRGVRKTA